MVYRGGWGEGRQKNTKRTVIGKKSVRCSRALPNDTAVANMYIDQIVRMHGSENAKISDLTTHSKLSNFAYVSRSYKCEPRGEAEVHTWYQ